MGKETSPTGKHLSATQLLTYEMCGECYRRLYIEGARPPRGPDMLRGTIVHRARRQSLTRRIEQGELPPVEEVEDVTATLAREEYEAGEVAVPADMSPGKMRGEVKDSAVRLAVCDRTVVQPTFIPRAVERKTVIEIGGLPPIIAYSDVDDTDNRVHELKTGGRGSTFPRGVADRSEQITTYCLALAKSVGLEVVAASLEKLRDLVSGPVAGVQETVRTLDHFQALLNRFATMQRAIEAGIFMPASEGHWKCSPKYCDFYGTCPYVARPVSVSMSVGGE